MYYKFIKDGKIIDVQKSKEFAYVRMDPDRRVPFRCESDDPEAYGIISSDSSVIYVLTEIEMKEISAEQYDALKEELDASRIPDDISEEEEQEEVDRPPTRAELLAMIESQAETITELEDAILEMSEVVYAE